MERSLDHEIAETVIRVQERMTYTSVKKILEDEDEAERERYQDLVPMFQRMGELSAILRKRRQKRGSIDFDFPESEDDPGRTGTCRWRSGLMSATWPRS